jgi:sec-independent protein translocase protein TatB
LRFVIGTLLGAGSVARLPANTPNNSTPPDLSWTAPQPEYKHPQKNWRLKRSAMPHWYKARQGVRTRALSGAARVARYRPPGNGSNSF